MHACFFRYFILRLHVDLCAAFMLRFLRPCMLLHATCFQGLRACMLDMHCACMHAAMLHSSNPASVRVDWAHITNPCHDPPPENLLFPQVHDHAPDFAAYATRLSNEFSSVLGTAMAAQQPCTAALSASAAAAAQRVSRLPTVVRSVITEGCVQLVAWVTSAAAQLVRSGRATGRAAAAATCAEAPDPQHSEQDILDSLLDGSELLREARSATVQVGSAFAEISAGSDPAVSPPANSTKPDEHPELHPLFAWPCCLAATTPGATASSGASGALDVIEVHLSPARAAAAAGVQQLRVRALIVSGSDLLLDVPLVVDTRCPVARCVGHLAFDTFRLKVVVPLGPHGLGVNY